MLAVLITLTPGCRNEFIDREKAKVCIAVLPIMDVKTHSNSTLELLELAYRVSEFTRERLNNPTYSNYQPLFTTQDEWTVIKYAMEVLRPFWYWTVWMSKLHTVTLHLLFTVYNDMFDHMDGMMWALTKKMTQWKEDLFFAVKYVQQKLAKNYTEVTPTTRMLLISAYIIDPFRMLRSFRKCGKTIDINTEDKTSYTIQYQEAFLKYVENKYCPKHRLLLVTMSDNTLNNNLSSFEMASRSAQSSYNPYNLCTDDDEYLMPTNVAETTPNQSDCAARSLTATMLYLNSPPELTHN